MKISWNCLNQLIDLTDIGHMVLVNTLILAGFETGDIKLDQGSDDIILEIDLTANRSDITSLIDIAVEISALINKPLKVDLKIQQNYTKHGLIIQRITNNRQFFHFNKFNACTIPKLQLKKTDESIKKYLLAHDKQPLGNFLDIVEFINLKWGQNIQIFKIAGEVNKLHQKLNTDIKFNNEYGKPPVNTINTENKGIIKIDADNIDKQQDYENILLVNYEYKKQNFSKSRISNIYTLNAYKEIINLAENDIEKTLAWSTVYMYHDIYVKDTYVDCKKSKIHQILGPINSSTRKKYLNESLIIQILQNLNFAVQNLQNVFRIKVPPQRQADIQRDTDIIEELGRIYGFNNFIDRLPAFAKTSKKPGLTTMYQKIRKILRSIGLHEVINYSLENINDNQLNIINPLNQQQHTLRKSLINNLIGTKLYNKCQSNETLEIFEIGKVFTKYSRDYDCSEEIHLAGLIGNPRFNRSTWEQSGQELSWFQAKGQLEEVFERLHANIKWSTSTSDNNLKKSLKDYVHTKRTIYMTYNHQTIGLFSQINNKTSKNLEISHRMYLFEINISKLADELKISEHTNYGYLAYSNYPKITRDISIKIRKNASIELINRMIIQTLKHENILFLESVRILNEYYKNKENRVISLRLTYRSNNRTLTNKEIEMLDNIFKNKLSSFLEIN